MSAVWTLARKDLRLLLRDRVAAVLLLLLPLVFILVLGLLLGEGFGQRPDDTLRLSLVDLDKGRALHPKNSVGGKSWAHWVRRDFEETPGIRIEIVPDRETAERLVRDHKRAAVLVLTEEFSERLSKCSFLAEPGGVNPFHREGVYLDRDNRAGIDLGIELLRDPTQGGAAAIIEQVVQVTMLRVVLPYMIGQAFDKLSEPQFIRRLGDEVNLPMPEDFPVLADTARSLLKDPRVTAARFFDKKMDATLKKMEGRLKGLEKYTARDKLKLAEMIELAAGGKPEKVLDFQERVGSGVQSALRQQFSKYDLTGMTWAALTRSQGEGKTAQVSEYEDREGSGLLKRGAHRYQVLVPAYTVMFAFFLTLIVGWVFVAERRQGTLQRLRAAPIGRGQIVLGKMLPCFAISLMQGAFLLVAGRLLFGMRWGPDHWTLPEQTGWLLLVVFCTSLAAMGLALLVAALVRTEIQAALFGSLAALVLALIGGCVLPREMMPEQTQKFSRLTPQGWALDAYRELLSAGASYEPNLSIVLTACLVLSAFGAVSLALAWGLLRLD